MKGEFIFTNITKHQRKSSWYSWEKISLM